MNSMPTLRSPQYGARGAFRRRSIPLSLRNYLRSRLGRLRKRERHPDGVRQRIREPAELGAGVVCLDDDDCACRRIRLHDDGGVPNGNSPNDIRRLHVDRYGQFRLLRLGLAAEFRDDRDRHRRRHRATATITVQCTNTTPYSVGLDNGQNASGASAE